MVEGLRSSEPESAVREAILANSQDEEGSKKSAHGRVIVQITRCSTALLDSDNLGGSVKFLLDAIRYSGLIPDDDPASIELQVSQIKVARRKEVGTHIRITRA
jgi:hypothetical protein